MTYVEIEVLGQEHIIIDLGNNEFKSFPANAANPEYVAFLKALDDDTIEAE
jgi:hypothetical protein